MSEVFQLIYDGKALDNHEIAPRDLSIALVAINDILENADKILNKGKTKTEVKVKASFETGCFKINFASYQSFVDKAVELFNSNAVNASLNAIEILVMIGGLVKLLKFLKGQKPTKIIENENKTFSVFKNNEEYHTEKGVIELYKNYKLRQDFEKLVEPLNKSGIDDLAIMLKNKEEPLCQIKKDEQKYFLCPKQEEEPLDEPQRFETNISIVNLSFKEGNKWFINDGGESYYVTVEDNEFLEQINNSFIRFAKGDILKVKIRRQQYYNSDDRKLKSEHFIEKVIHHKTPDQTLKLLWNPRLNPKNKNQCLF